MSVDRRAFLRQSSGLLAAAAVPAQAGDMAFARPAPIAAVRANADRIIDIAVCTRPFRAQGPRIEAEQRFGKTLVHNYGHGGSGWSLSWGSARLAVDLALTTREKRIAVIGCGAIGLTSARVAQRAGLRVTIYCQDRPPDVRSSAATGVWSPDSRICTQEHATPAFARQWEAMARRSFRMYQSLLGLPGDPVRWQDGYVLSDVPFDQPMPPSRVEEPDYPDLEALLHDIRPRGKVITAAEHPFPVPHVRRFTQMVFNIPVYARLLMDDFLREGGHIEQRTFVHARELAGLRERTIIHATGYGARALFGDQSIVPVRGQTARLVPQPEVDYGVIWRGHNLFVVPRSDGVLVQAQGEHDWNNEDTQVDRPLTVDAVARLASLFGPAPRAPA